jgi:hypothetical protein
MPKLAETARRVGLGTPWECRRPTRDEIDRALALTHDPEPRVRQAALMNLCPCHLRANVPEVWERVFELAKDPDRRVRGQVVHTLIDGSPKRLEERVIAALEATRRDHPGARRAIGQLLAQYRRTGRVNHH